RATWAVLVAEAGDVVAELGHRGGRARAGEARADDDHVVLPLVRRVHQLHLELAVVPLLIERPPENMHVEHQAHRTTPKRTASGNDMFAAIVSATITVSRWLATSWCFGCDRPSVFSMLIVPCLRCMPRSTIATR